MGMFASAKVIEAKKPSTKKDKDQVQTKGLRLYAALVAVKKNIEAQIEVAACGIRADMMEHFIDEGMRTGAKPVSYRGVEGGASASLEFRQRSSASGLNPDERALLTDYNVPFSEAVAREETFVINPAYADLSDEKNAKMLEQVEQALSALGLPADFIMKQEKESKFVVDDATIEAVVKMKKKETVAALMPVISVLAIKPVLASTENAFQIVDEVMNAPVEAEA